MPVKIIIPEYTEELALTLNGKKSRLAQKDFLAFGKNLKLSDSQLQKALDRIIRAVLAHLSQCLDESFLPQEMIDKIVGMISERISAIAES